MPRSISLSFRQAAESSFSDDVNLCFLTMTHPQFGSDALRVVWDVKDFVRGGLTFTAFPFDINILSDDEQPPQAQLRIQNVSPRIGNFLRFLNSPIRLKIELLSSMDFNLNVDPRTEIGTPNVAYSADKLFLTNISVDVREITASIEGWDYLQRVYPGKRATQDVFPGAFR